MNTQIIQHTMQKSLQDLGHKQTARTYAKSVVHSLKTFFEVVEIQVFPEYLQGKYRQLKTHATGTPNHDKAQKVVDEFIALLSEVQTHQNPDDPGERYFTPSDSAYVKHDPDGTDAWRANSSDTSPSSAAAIG